jgi:hypothetical protein
VQLRRENRPTHQRSLLYEISHPLSRRLPGGIDNEGGTLTVVNSTISGNSGLSGGGGLTNNGNGTVMIANSTISGNSSDSGGGIHNAGTMTIANSTISGNSCVNAGGGLVNLGKVTIIA